MVPSGRTACATCSNSGPATGSNARSTPLPELISRTFVIQSPVLVLTTNFCSGILERFFLGLVTGCRNRNGADRVGQLDSGQTDTACGCRDQNAVACVHLTEFKQTVSRQILHPDRSA